MKQVIGLTLVIAALFLMDSFVLENVAAEQCGRQYTTDLDLHNCMAQAGFEPSY